MKTKYMITKVLKALALVTMALSLANCAKSDNGGTAAVTGTYTMINNICYLNNNGTLTQQTNTALCTSGTGYQLVNGICYQNVNGQLIQQSNTALCTSGTGYQLVGGICYQNVNGQLIQQSNTALCTNSGGLTCSGFYTDGQAVAQCIEGSSRYTGQAQQTPWGFMQVTVMDCTGYTLMNSSSQTVTCQ